MKSAFFFIFSPWYIGRWQPFFGDSHQAYLTSFCKEGAALSQILKENVPTCNAKHRGEYKAVEQIVANISKR